MAIHPSGLKSPTLGSYYCSRGTATYYWYNISYVIDSAGNHHWLDALLANSSCPTGQTPQGTVVSQTTWGDSGYLVTLNGVAGTATVTDTNGVSTTQVIPTTSIPPGPPYQPGWAYDTVLGTTTSQDPNGNLNLYHELVLGLIRVTTSIHRRR